ncbi:MAG: beta-galactosidase [Thermoprotei archaeon]
MNQEKGGTRLILNWLNKKKIRNSSAIGIAVLALVLLPAWPVASGQSIAPENLNRIWSVQVGNIEDMNEGNYQDIAASGANSVELQLFWSAIEPLPGHFSFSTLDKNVDYAEQAGLHVIFMFWYGPFEPQWISSYELTSSSTPVGNGRLSTPPWWNKTDMNYYIQYVNATISRYLRDPYFLGAYVNYGWLDTFWAGGGYSNSSLQAFQAYLEKKYGNIVSLDNSWGTSYTSFSKVVAPKTSSQPGWLDFEGFRIWSLNYTLNKIYSTIYPSMKKYGKTLFIYWGGSVTDCWNLINYPDIIFWLAKRYDAVVNLDDSSGPALAKVFTDLARVYGVRYVQEWTPPPLTKAYRAVFEMSVAQLPLGLPYGIGYDFFDYPPTWCEAEYPIYSLLTSSLPSGNFQAINSSVGALFDFFAETANPGAASGEEDSLYYLIYDYIPFKVITDYEIKESVVNLSQFKYLIDLGGFYNTSLMPRSVNAAITRWINGGGVLLRVSSNGSIYAESTGKNVDIRPISTINVPFFQRLQSVELYPIVDKDRGIVFLVVDVTPFTQGGSNANLAGQGLGSVPSNFKISLNLSLLNLSLSGQYYVVNLSDASLIAGPLTASKNLLNFSLKVSAPQLDFIEIGPESFVARVRALNLSAPSRTITVNSPLKLSAYYGSPLSKQMVTNITILVNGSLYVPGSTPSFNSSGTYYVYASYGGKFSNSLKINVQANTVARSYSAYELGLLAVAISIILVVIIANIYLKRKLKARLHFLYYLK